MKLRLNRSQKRTISPDIQSVTDGQQEQVAQSTVTRHDQPLNERYLNKQTIWKVILIVAFLGLIVLIPKVLLSRGNNSATVDGSGSTTPISSLTINKGLSFNARDSQDRIIEKRSIAVTLKDASLSRSILYNGQSATTRGGKLFLLLNFTLDNPYQESYYMPINDLIRLQVGNKSYAPDNNNTLVLIDPISSRNARVFFIVDANTHTFTMKVGEINGDKQTIDLKL